MEKSATRRSRLTALGAIALALVLAFLNPDGVLQPAGVFLGWAAVVVLAAAVVAGYPRMVALSAVLEIIRAALGEMAGDRPLSPPVWAFLIFAMVDLASSSFAERQHPVGYVVTILRAAGSGVAGGLVVWAAGLGLRAQPLTGNGWPLLGLVAALGIGGIVSHVMRRSPAAAE